MLDECTRRRDCAVRTSHVSDDTVFNVSEFFLDGEQHYSRKVCARFVLLELEIGRLEVLDALQH